MSEHKGPRPVAWEGWEAKIYGCPAAGKASAHVEVVEAGDEGRDYTMTPAEAERHGLAHIMAAAVARGEQGHAGALNRVARVLDDAPVGRPAEQVVAALRGDLDAALAALANATQEAARLRVDLGEAAAERDAARNALAAVRDTLGVVGNGSPLLAADALREEADALRASVAELREDLADAEAARADAVQEATRLRVDLSAAQVELSGARDLVRACHGLLYSGGTPTREPMTHASLASIEEHGVMVGDRLDMQGRVTLRHVRMVCNARPYIRCDSGNMLTDGDSVERGVVEALEAVEAPDAD